MSNGSYALYLPLDVRFSQLYLTTHSSSRHLNYHLDHYNNCYRSRRPRESAASSVVFMRVHGTSNGCRVRPSHGVSHSVPRAVSVAARTVSHVRPKPAVQPFRCGGTGLHSDDGEMMDRDGVWKSERASDGVSENTNQRAVGARATHFGYAAPERCTHPRRRWRWSGYII